MTAKIERINNWRNSLVTAGLCHSIWFANPTGHLLARAQRIEYVSRKNTSADQRQKRYYDIHDVNPNFVCRADVLRQSARRPLGRVQTPGIARVRLVSRTSVSVRLSRMSHSPSTRAATTA